MNGYSLPGNNLSPGQTKWIRWIRQNELAAFFVLAFVFTWTIYIVVAFLEFKNQATLSRTLLIAAFGPSVSALIISSALTSKTGTRKAGKRIALFFLVFALGTVVEWLDHLWWNHSIDSSLILVDAILISLAAIVISGVYSSHQGVRELASQITNWQAGILWYFVALGLWPVIILIGNFIAHLSNVNLSAAPTWPSQPIALLLVESLVWYFLFGGPLNEEPGWRGYALPRLQRRFSPLVASLILGSLWGLWHVPLHLMGVYYGGAWGAVIRIQEIPRAILFTWLYNRTNGSVLIAILFHAAINVTSLFLPRSYVMVMGICTLTAVAVVLGEKMWKRQVNKIGV